MEREREWHGDGEGDGEGVCRTSSFVERASPVLEEMLGVVGGDNWMEMDNIDDAPHRSCDAPIRKDRHDTHRYCFHRVEVRTELF